MIRLAVDGGLGIGEFLEYTSLAIFLAASTFIFYAI